MESSAPSPRLARGPCRRVHRKNPRKACLARVSGSEYWLEGGEVQYKGNEPKKGPGRGHAVDPEGSTATSPHGAWIYSQLGASLGVPVVLRSRRRIVSGPQRANATYQLVLQAVCCLCPPIIFQLLVILLP